MKDYYIPKNLLSKNNAKTIKGEKNNVITYIMYLAPYKQNSKGINLCSHASKGCASACLFNSGNARFDRVQKGKINKTEYFLADRVLFLEQLYLEISFLELRYKKSDMKLAIRLNGTSDIRFEKFKIKDNKNIFQLFPNIQFYDYTKNHHRFNQLLPKNYDLTFSRSETNHNKSIELLSKGINVAMVFDKVPTSYMGYKVINGDENDIRFNDERGVIVGLKYKNVTIKGSNNKKMKAENDFIINIEKGLKLKLLS